MPTTTIFNAADKAGQECTKREQNLFVDSFSVTAFFNSPKECEENRKTFAELEKTVPETTISETRIKLRIPHTFLSQKLQFV